MHRCRKAVGDAFECDVVKRENEMTPLDARAGDHESMTNREPQMLHGYPRHESGAGCINVRRADTVSLYTREDNEYNGIVSAVHVICNPKCILVR